ncbi:F0F1 ATP synthase subunit delta [Demequina capsici]|uniref:ATP synthase subunit delta n=1 Tax=Demequina capsici TaxID=3075620 RepID=A0AA96J8W2_9MICO|nr:MULTISPECIES: F0F1 ATP synthase subunit delta [unclassified Demequina]WNM23798.1 F0F1 ATP synthase subunit delta [Demequina sp. OYTSA14]WNM26637.1 F0F1 ATP synthase subunit delta [Demequina sp. PMTSA13]
MRGTSQSSRAAVLREFEPVAIAAGAEGMTLASQLFVVVDALDGSGSLRRALSDPARDGSAKSALVSQLFSSLDSRVIDVVSAFAGRRWSEDEDIVVSIEDAGVNALLASAQADGSLEAVEDELFHVQRLLEGERDLLVALSNRSVSREVRLELLEGILKGRLSAVTTALLNRAVSKVRGQRLITTVKQLVETAAERRGRLLASVVSAVELSASQRQRLSAILERAYGRQVQLNVAVDPAVLGGIKVQVGTEVVDGTVFARLDEARRRLVS